MNNKNSLYLRIFAGILLAAIVLTQIPAWTSLAQVPVTTWDEPVNVSRTGGTTLPVLAQDSTGHLHVFWTDTFADQGYAQWDGQTWSPSNPAIFNFGSVSPQILNDQNGNLFAFWIDGTGLLLFSSANAANAGQSAGWASPKTLASDALAYSAAIGNNGKLYVGYVIGSSADGTPAGVYVRTSSAPGAGWGPAITIDQSEYFRALTVVNARVHVSVSQGTDQDSVFVAWDDVPLKRVYLKKSMDEGETWNEPIEIDGPKPGVTPPAPFNIQSIAYDSNLLVIWQSSLQSSFDCTQNYQFSSDQGETWQSPAIMLEDLVGCPQSIQLFQGPEELVFMLAMVQETSYLVAWDGSNWSLPQSQQILNSFSDPVSYNLVKLANLNGLVSSENDLYVVGSDTVGNLDTWVMHRELGTTADWFPPATSWTKPQLMFATETAIDNIRIVADQNNVFHAIWRETSATQSRDRIFYAYFKDQAWTDPVEIVKSPDHKIGELSLIYGENDNLYLVWNGITKGEIYFSWANTKKSASPFEWAEPVALAINGEVTSVSIKDGITGELDLVYAIPINEDRGIYFIRSSDQGKTWSEPTTVFDANANGWDMVGDPHLVQTGKGLYHAIWTKNSILENGNSTGLYYSYSLDDGVTWSQPVEIIDHGIKSSWLESEQTGVLHRLWLVERGSDVGIWHEVSADHGITWARSAPIALAGTVGTSNIKFDDTGHVHAFLSYSIENQQSVINHLWWNGAQWLSEDPLELLTTQDSIPAELEAAVNQNGIVMLVGRTGKIDPTTNLPVEELTFSTRIFEQTAHSSAGPIMTPQPEIIMTAIPTVQVNQTLMAATPTPGGRDFVQNSPRPNSGNATTTIFVGATAAVLLILGGMVLYKKFIQ